MSKGGRLRYATVMDVPQGMREACTKKLQEAAAGIFSKAVDAALKAEPQRKYRNSPSTVDGIRFDSKKEARRYEQLKQMKAAGQVRWFIRQVPFHLPGRIRYLADFLVVTAAGDVVVEDVKSGGTRTRVYINKRKQVREIYGVEITEI